MTGSGPYEPEDPSDQVEAPRLSEALWAILIDEVEPVIHRMTAARRLSPDLAEDVFQEVCTRLLLELRRSHTIERPRRWMLKTARNLLCDVQRGRSVGIGPMRETQVDPAGLDRRSSQERSTDPARAAMLRDLWARAPEVLQELPPPYAQVSDLQLIQNWTRSEIIAYLQRWVPVTEETGRAIIRRMHEMLVPLFLGESPRELWPGRYAQKKNPWHLTPPPSSASSGIEAA